MISVVVPVYNGAHILPTTVPAVLALEAVSEVVWVNDGSTDGTRRALADLVGDAPGARVLSLPDNVGRAAARNAGIAATTGDLVVFFDADVEPPPGAAAALAATAREPGTVAAVARTVSVVTDPREPYQEYLALHPRGPQDDIQPEDPISWRFFLSGASAVRRTALVGVGGYDDALGYGEDLALGCALREVAHAGLRLASTTVRVHDVGTLDRGIENARAFGRSMRSIEARCPDFVRVPPGGRVLSPLAVPVLYGLVRRLPPGGARRRLVRYLLAAVALRASRD